MDESEVLHAIDRALTDLLPDKHQYEADLQLYLDYSLPPHPELPSMEGEQLDEHCRDAYSADDVVLERDWPDGMDTSEQQSLHGNDKQLAVLTEYSVEEEVLLLPQDARSVTDVWPETAFELNDNADDSQALRDGSAAPEHLQFADEVHNEGPRGEPAATPKTVPQAGVHKRLSQADGAAGHSRVSAAEDGACADSGSQLDGNEERAPEDTEFDAELPQNQGDIKDDGRQASLAHNAKPVAGRNWAAHISPGSACSKCKDIPLHSQILCPGAAG